MEIFQIYFLYKIKGKVYFPKATVRLNNARFETRKNTMDIAHLSSYYEKETTDYLLEHNPPIFIDIGAHIGRFTVLLAKQGSKVLSIEACKETFDQLNINVLLNNVQERTTLINLACSDKNGEELFYFNALNEGANSLFKIDNSESQKIEVKKLEDIIEDHNLILDQKSIIKIDIEGAEINALKGGLEVLKKNSPILILEILDKKRESEISQFLSRIGYSLKEIIDSRNFVFKKI